MKAIAQAYASNRECSVQETVCHCLPELFLRKVFPGVMYANTNISEKRCKILRSQQKISKLTDESEDIFKKNMLDRYMDRPDKKFQMEILLQSILYVMQNSLDTIMFVLYQIKMIGNLWNLLMIS